MERTSPIDKIHIRYIELEEYIHSQEIYPLR